MTVLRYELFMLTEDDAGGRTASLGVNYLIFLLYKLPPFNSWSEDERTRAAIDVLVGLADDGLSEFWDRPPGPEESTTDTSSPTGAGRAGSRGAHPMDIAALRYRLERLVPIWWNDETGDYVYDFDWELTPAGEALISWWYEEPPSVMKNRSAVGGVVVGEDFQLRAAIRVLILNIREWRHRNEGGSGPSDE